MTKVLLAGASVAALVAMHRDPAEYPAPHSADVHPNEVANFLAAGWREGGVESVAADAPQDPALMSREQLIEFHLAVVRGQIEHVGDDELRESLARYQDRQKFNGADPSAFDHDGDGSPGGGASAVGVGVRADDAPAGVQANGDQASGEKLSPAAGPDYSDEAHARTAKLTVAEIQADLAAMEIEFDPKASKADLLALRNAERQKRGRPLVGDDA